jgi:hypothetical protein
MLGDAAQGVNTFRICGQVSHTGAVEFVPLFDGFLRGQTVPEFG